MSQTPPQQNNHARRTIGYVRVSTPDQNIDRQVHGLQSRCDDLFVEHISGAASHRPIFERALQLLKRGDTLMVWDLDRAFRSTLDAVKTAEILRKRGIDLNIVSLNIDTATPEGEFYYTMVAAVAQFERRMLSRRTREGMEAARQRGVRFGRKHVIGREDVQAAHDLMHQNEWSLSRTATHFGFSRATLSRAFRREGLVAVLTV